MRKKCRRLKTASRGVGEEAVKVSGSVPVLVVLALLAISCGGERTVGEKWSDAVVPSRFTVDKNKVFEVPNWDIENLKVDSECSTLFDYCVTVTCDIVSKGAKSESGTATIWLKQEGRNLEMNRALTLGAGQRQTQQHKFSEASAFQDNPTGGCRTVTTGARVECSVSNSGGSGNANVTFKVTDIDSGRTETKVERVHLDGQRSRSMEKLFPGFVPTGRFSGGCSVQNL